MLIGIAIYYIAFLVPALGMVILIGWLTRRVRPNIRTPLLVLVSCLLLTPTWGPATIAVVPVAFGWLLVPTILTGSWSDLAGWIASYPRWHAFAFPATALVAYSVIRAARPNNSVRDFPSTPRA